mgnify:CR=1 FL=1
MLYKYFTEKLLGLQDVDIEKLEEIDNSIHINCRLKRKPHKCPCCGKRFRNRILHMFSHQMQKQAIA